MKNSFEDFVKEIKVEIHRSSKEIKPWHSFWTHRPTKDFPPNSIRFPEDYDGSDRLNIICTQTDLSASQQKKLAEEWCEVLPTLENVRFLWFHSRVSQSLFEASCDMENLIGLYIKWSGIKSIDSIQKLKTLRFLYIGSSPSVAPLDPLGELPALDWLELENIRAASDLGFLGDFTNLIGLSISGDTNSLKDLAADSLQPLENLQKLYWLSLYAFKTTDGSLMPLVKLGSLKYLFLSNNFKMEEYAKLAGARPDIECDRLRPISDVLTNFTCKKCNDKRMVMLIGKGKPFLCVDCDAGRIAKHVDAFNQIAEGYKS